MITYDWQVSRLDCLPMAPEGADYVVTAHWRLVGTDGQYSGTVYSTCGFPVVQGETFVPYADLTLDISIDPSLPPPPSDVKTYTVVAGDSLWKIAQTQLGNGARYPEIIKANPGKLKDEKSVIHPGDVLVIP